MEESNNTTLSLVVFEKIPNPMKEAQQSSLKKYFQSFKKETTKNKFKTEKSQNKSKEFQTIHKLEKNPAKKKSALTQKEQEEIKAKTEQEIHYLVPIFSKTKAAYVWSGLAVSPSRISNAGMGLFATTFLPKFTAIPYLGDVLDFRSTGWKVSDLMQTLNEKTDVRPGYLLFRSPGVYVDGYSARHTKNYKNICISGFANEATSPYLQNTFFFRGYLITKRDIFPQEEIYVYYGPHYQREYKVVKLGSSKLNKKQAKLLLPISTYKKFFNIQERTWKGIKKCKQWASLKTFSKANQISALLF